MTDTTIIDAGSLNRLWSSLLIEELARHGVEYCCISPGSRSSPLTVAAARHRRVRTIVCHDERGAAFHALGYARAAGKPAVLLCTSGTAAANYYPALIEAALDHVPLLALSADRPPELQETGANQTIRQSHLFGSYCKWFFALPCPTPTIAPAMLLTTVNQAVYQALGYPAGPVHLNCAFREPLEPATQPVAPDYLDSLSRWLESNTPYTRYPPARPMPVSDDVERISQLIDAAPAGLAVVGRLSAAVERDAVERLLRRLQWPVHADVTSGLRLGAGPVTYYFDQLLLSAALRSRYRPTVLLHLGGQVVSKRLLEFIDDSPSLEHYIVVQPHPGRYDPTHRVSWHVEAAIEPFCEALSARLEPGGGQARELTALSAAVDAVTQAFIESEPSLNEIAVARTLSEHIPADHGLWLASSMPIRDMDMYASPAGPPVRVGANRGASGIEGGVAAAAGFAVGLNRPVTLLTGDLALLHDLNSLLLVTKIQQPLIIVVINNDGGGIFSFLPIAAYEDVFEPYFVAPHGLRFQAAAQLFGLDYAAPATLVEFIACYRAALAAGKSSLIEVITDRDENRRLHRTLQRAIVERIDRHWA